MTHHSPQTPGTGSSPSDSTQPAAAGAPQHQPQPFEDIRRIAGKLPSGDAFRDAWLLAVLASLCFGHLRETRRRWIFVAGAPRTARRLRTEDRLGAGLSAAQGLASTLCPHAPKEPQDQPVAGAGGGPVL